MTLAEYQKLAARTINPNLTKEQMCDHSAHGMISEIGEIHSIYQKTYQGHPFDKEYVKKELGDFMWFLAEYHTSKDMIMDYEINIPNVGPTLNSTQLLFSLSLLVSDLGLYRSDEEDTINMSKNIIELIIYDVPILCSIYNCTLEEICEMNIEKLKARYPEGFEIEKSLHRKEGDI